MDWIWVTTWPWCVNCLSHWLQAFLTLSCLHLVWYHNPARVSNIFSQSWHVNFASIDTTSVFHLLLYPISYISAAAAPAARPRSSCATSLGLPKYFYIKILKYIPCINKYLVTWLTMSSVPARRGSTQCWEAKFTCQARLHSVLGSKVYMSGLWENVWYSSRVMVPH